jgi:hypothetical protein
MEVSVSQVSDTNAEVPATRVGAPWSVAEEAALYDGFSGLGDIQVLAARLGRSRGGITGRLKSLGLVEYDANGLLSVCSPKPAFKPIATLASPDDRPSKRDRSLARRPPMASLNASEQYCVRIFRQIPRERRKELFLVMRILASVGSIEESEAPPDDDAEPDIPPDVAPC